MLTINFTFQQSQDASFVVDDGMASFGVSRAQDSLFDDFLRPPVTSSASFTTTTTASASQQTNVTASLSMPVFTPREDLDTDGVISSQAAPFQQDSLTVTTCTNNSLTSERSGRLTLGKRSLAGIVISSGPGGHFETYEGTQKSAPARTVLRENTYTMCDVKPNTSLLRVNRPASTKMSPCPVSDVSAVSHNSHSVSETLNNSFMLPVIEADINWQQLHTITTDLTQLTYEDVSTLEPLSPLPVTHTSLLDGLEPAALAPVTSMHELSNSLLRCRQTVERCSSSRDTTVERRDMESEEDNLGGQGK